MRRVDFLVITVLEVEMAALNRFGFERRVDSRGRAYHVRRFENGAMEREVEIIHYCTGEAGNVGAGILVSSLLDLWKPRCVAVLGIAAGVKRNSAAIGDILIGSGISYYSSTMESKAGTERRPDSIPVDNTLLSQMTALGNEIMSRIDRGFEKSVNLLARVPKLLVGPILSGEAVVRSQALVDELLDQIHPKAVGIEMESYGVHRACWTNQRKPRAITIRGVSDLGDAQKDNSYHEYAASLAATFFINFACKCDLNHIGSLEPEPVSREISLGVSRARFEVGYKTESKHAFEIVHIDKENGLFALKGSAMALELRLPHVLSCWVLEPVTLPNGCRIQLGVSLDMSCQVRREFLISYASLRMQYVLVDAYHKIVASAGVIEKTLQGLGDYRFESEESRDQETHLYLTGPLGVDIRTAVEHPYRVGVFCEIGLLNGASITDANGSGPFWIKVEDMEWASY